MLTCTWAPTTFQGPQVVGGATAGAGARTPPSGAALRELVRNYVQRVEALGISHLLIPQRWWGSGEEMEGSSLDCLAMTSFIAAHTERLQLITAIHPGFFHPTTIAKWGATLSNLSDGRWAINLTSGWNLKEFAMYGVPALEHDERYARSAEFLEVLRRAWSQPEVTFRGRYYQVEGLRMEPRPRAPLAVYQGGQSDAALDLAARHSDWMFLNGGAPEKIQALIERARERAAANGRTLRFALYAAPLCRATDTAAWAEIDALLARIDPTLAERRRHSVGGAQGMWSGNDPLSLLDTNEGYASRLIGSPDTILTRVRELKALGVDLLHVDIRDELFVREVLPELARI
ncbi:MAG: LLM class flavin-dependent oxidoreductase [Pseudomonadales bacterium]